MPSLSRDPASPALASSRAHSPEVAIVSAILLFVALAAAISVDVVNAGYKVKSDEATYVAMALSMAYDRDLTYERRDLERFWGIYQQGPEGIFLKRGRQLRIGRGASPPYVRVSRPLDSRRDRLYFGKAMIYSVAAAPFVWLLGMNGFYVFHVLLLFAACACGYRFLAARSRPGPALAFTLGFVGASVVPVHAVFLMPEIFNLTLVFVAYFLWLYKKVAQPRSRLLSDGRSDALAALLLGIATYSKPTNAPLVMPLVLLLWWRRQWWRGVVIGALFAAAAGALFSMNALISGEFNYQGGDRKTFYSGGASYSGFPLDSPQGTWDQRGLPAATNELGAANVLQPSEIVRLFGNNLKYFLIGRHFGFVPYFFPGVVVLLAWALSRDRFQAWRVLTLAGVGTANVVLLVVLAYTWSGGGGPPGNRYFLSVYPALFFLMPPLESAAPALLAWVGGALFTAKMLVNPFVAAKFTWEMTERGFARRLPVELTMANDLPVMLAQPPRGHIPYGQDGVLLYFLDRHGFPPEPVGVNDDGSVRYGIWISGSGRADIIVRSVQPIHHLTITAVSPIRTIFTVSIGASASTVPLAPGRPMTFDVPASGVHGLRSYAYLLSARSSEGFTPHLQDPQSRDSRNLGVIMRFQAVGGTPAPVVSRQSGSR